MICFIPTGYPRGRILLRCGTVDVGAIFPGTRQSCWRWRVWVTSSGGAREGISKSEHAAKNDAMTVFLRFLEAADLKEAGGAIAADISAAARKSKG